MRPLATILLLIALASPAIAQQRIFRALPIDEAQNDRLDTAENRLDRIETSIDKLTNAVADLAAMKTAPTEKPAQLQVASVVKPAPAQEPVIRHIRTVALPPQISQIPVQPPQQIIYPAAPQSNRYSQAELASIVRSHFPNGWSGQYTDVSPRSGVWRHLGQHGFSSDQISGLDMNTALGLHALEHAGKVSPYRSRSAAVQQPQYQVAAYQPPQPQVQYASGCANGQCARPSYSRSAPVRVGLFGRLR